MLLRSMMISLYALAQSCSPTPQPVPVPVPDSCTGTLAHCACTVMCELGCRGTCGTLCEPAIALVLSERVLAFDAGCVARAKTKVEVALCQGAACD